MTMTNPGHKKSASQDVAESTQELGFTREPSFSPKKKSDFKAWVHDFRSTFLWLMRGMFASVGLPRMMWISFQAFIGSIAMSVMSFAIIFIIRSAAPSDDASFRGLPIPDWPLPVMLSALLGGGMVGAFTFYRSEQQSSDASVAFGDYLRRRTVNSLNRPLTRGWQTALAGRPQQVVTQALVSGVREITMAARELIRLVGPISMFTATLAVLLILEPVITLLLVPVGLIFAVPVYFINKRMSGLNDSFDEAQELASKELNDSIEALLESGYTDRAEETIEAARMGDKVTHERMLEPIRLRAMSVVLTSFFAAAVLCLFLLRNGEGDLDFLRLIIYVITLRLCSNAGQKMASTMINITRRASAIDRYRALETDLEAYRELRIDRLDSAEVPDAITVESAEGETLELRRGQTTVVVVPRPPSRATADELLIALERNCEANGDVYDLLGSARVFMGEDEFLSEQHVVGAAASDIQHRLRVVVGVDVATAALDSGPAITIVVTHMPANAWDKALGEWDHLVSGVMAVVDGQVVRAGSLDWVGSNRKELLASLGR